MGKDKVVIKSSYEYLGGPNEWKDFQERNRALRHFGNQVLTAEPKDVVPQVVDIYSDGTRMTGTLWKPKQAVNAPNGSYPAILLCHGWGGIRANLDARFARVFAKAGFVTLTFDYRTWNDSDGVLVSPSNEKDLNQAQQEQGRAEDFANGSGATVNGLKAHIVRQVVDMDWQLTDIEAALDFLDGEPVVDSNRIGIWGISQGGGHVISIGARHRDRVKAIVSQVPSCGVMGAGNPRSRVEEARKDAIARARGLKPLSVPQGVEQGHLPGMDGIPNLGKLVRYRPLETAHLIECPIFVMDADQEEVFDRMENGYKAYEIISKRNPSSEYIAFFGRHYDAYDGPDGQFKQATTKAIEFYRKHLGEPRTSKL